MRQNEIISKDWSADRPKSFILTGKLDICVLGVSMTEKTLSGNKGA